MSTQLLETMRETFGDGSELSPEKLKALLDETVKFFHEVQMKMQSGDPEQREEALNTTLDLKQALDGQIEKICRAMGVDPSQIASLTESLQFSSDQQDFLNQLKTQFPKPQKEKLEKKISKKNSLKIKLIG